MGCGILFPRDYRREWDDADDIPVPCGRHDAVNGVADVDAVLGAGDVGFSSSESEDEQWWERPNPDNGTKVQVHADFHCIHLFVVDICLYICLPIICLRTTMSITMLTSS